MVTEDLTKGVLLYPAKTTRHHNSMERRLQMLGSGLGLIAIGLMGVWEIVIRLG